MNKIVIRILIIVIFSFALSSQNILAYTGMSIHFATGVNSPSADFIKIVLGKKKQGHTHCSGIFAICPDQKLIDLPDCSYSGMELCIQIIHDGTNALPFQLHLLDDPSNEEDPLEIFVIHEDILIPVTGMPFTTAKIPAGSYPYNPTFGSYGGYSIPVIGIN